MFQCLNLGIISSWANWTKIIKNDTSSTCGKKSITNYALEVHTKTANLGQTFDCDIFEKSYKSVQGLDSHMFHKHSDDNFHSRYKCDHCDFATHRPKVLEDHVNIKHQGMEAYKCLICLKEFESKLAYHQHYKDHKDETITCPECSGICKTFSSFQKHYRDYHAKNSDKMCTCDTWGKEFKHARDMERHIGAVHLKIRFECDICGKSFPEKGKVISKIHMATFSIAQSVTRHLRTWSHTRHIWQFCIQMETWKRYMNVPSAIFLLITQEAW